MSFSDAARRISQSMYPGASSRRAAVRVGAFRLQVGVGIVAVGQLDHLHLEAFLEQHVEALARRLLPRVVLVEVHAPRGR